MTHYHVGLFTMENRKYVNVIISVPQKW